MAKRFVVEVQKKGLSLRRVILFGSFAKGNQHEWSDIDLAIVADEFGGSRFLDNRLIQDVKTRKPFFNIETHTYNTTDFEKGDNAFIDQEIKAKGLVIL